MSAPPRATSSKRSPSDRTSCDTDSGPSVLAILTGVVAAVAAVGVGYIMGREIERCSADDSSSEHKSAPELPVRRIIRQPQPTPSVPPPPVEEKDALTAYETATLCKVCLSNAMDCLLIPCRHEVCCRDCTLKLDECPLCRTHISDVMTIYKG